MIVSHDKRIIMFLPWKAATNTLAKRFGRHNQGRYHFYVFEPLLGKLIHRHLTCSDFTALPEARLPFRHATFVRRDRKRLGVHRR